MSRKKVLIIARSFPTGRMKERMEFKQSLRVLQYFLQTEQNLSYFSIVLQIQAKKKQNKIIAMYNEGFCRGQDTDAHALAYLFDQDSDDNAVERIGRFSISKRSHLSAMNLS